MSTDTNLFSYTGPDYDGQTIDDRERTFGTASTKPEWSDTLKYTQGLWGFKHQVGVVYGGAEDCIDINNRCKGMVIEASELHSGGKFVATVKGGSTEIVLRGEIVVGGSECDVDIGNYSDQNQDVTGYVGLDLHKRDGSPVRVRVLKAWTPVETKGSGPYVYLFPQPDTWYHDICVWFFYRTRKWFWSSQKA